MGTCIDLLMIGALGVYGFVWWAIVVPHKKDLEE